MTPYRQSAASMMNAERIRHERLVDFLTTSPDGHATNLAPNTLDRQRAVRRGFWRWANREGYIKADPADGLSDLYLGKGDRRVGRWLTRDEAKVMLAGCEHDDQGRRDHTLLLVALLTGLRRSEIASLTWRAVDLRARRITVRGKATRSPPSASPTKPTRAHRLAHDRLTASTDPLRDRTNRCSPPDTSTRG